MTKSKKSSIRLIDENEPLPELPKEYPTFSAKELFTMFEECLDKKLIEKEFQYKGLNIFYEKRGALKTQLKVFIKVEDKTLIIFLFEPNISGLNNGIRNQGPWTYTLKDFYDHLELLLHENRKQYDIKRLKELEEKEDNKRKTFEFFSTNWKPEN